VQNSEQHPVDEHSQRWQRIVTRLKLELGQTLFTFWLANLQLIAAAPDKVVLGVASRFERDRVSEMYGALLAKLVKEEWPDFGPVEFEIIRRARVEREERPVAPPPPRPQIISGSMALNPACSFATFVVGRANEIAAAEARRVAEGEANAGNPLFLFGGTGLGKSHLAAAVALRVLERAPTKRVLLVTAEWFVRNFIAAIRTGEIDAFKNSVRTVDLLVIDDLHIVLGKEKTTDELVQTLDALFETGKQIVLTADRSPALFDQLSERARSRLLKGTSVEIGPSDFDLRLAILEAKVARLRLLRPNVSIGGEALRFMAQRINANARELEGALHRIVSHSADGANPVTLRNLQVWLQDFLKVHDRRVTVEEIKAKVAAFYGCRASDLELPSRAREIVRRRQLAMYLARKLTTRSLPEIAARFKKKDHTTVLHAVRTIERLVASDPELARAVETLCHAIRPWSSGEAPPMQALA
jgi:chromosomal replication initiator protein